MEFTFDSSNSLFIIPNINFQKNNAVSFSNLNSFYGAPRSGVFYEKANNSVSNINNDRTGYNIRNNVLFRHAFAKKGRSLSLGFNVNFTNNDSENFNRSEFEYFDNNILLKDSLQNQFYDNLSTGRTIGGTIAYTEPVGKKSQVQFDYNPSVQLNKADQQTFVFDGQKYSQFDTSLSNRFDNRVTSNNGGVTYRYTPNKDEQFSVGLSYQHSVLESDRIFPNKANINQSFSNVLPNLMWRKKLSAASNIRVFFRASTSFPSVTQLQDVVNLTNPLRVSTGNPLLKQSNTQFVAGRYSYTNSKTSKSFFANLFLQTAGDFIANATYIPRRDSVLQNGKVLQKGSQLTKPVNLNGYRSARAFLTYSMPLKGLKTVLNLNAGLSYSRLPGLTNNREIITNNSVYSTGVVLASNISEFVDFNVSYNANFNQTTGTASGNNNYTNQAAGLQLNLLNKKGWFIQNDVSYQVNSGLSGGLDQTYGLWNAALGRKFLKNKVGELKLSVFDLLRQNQSVVRTVDERGIRDEQSVVLQRYFMLTFTYNLKNFGVAAKQAGRNNNGQQGERQRMPGGPGF
ncbi:MAG: outer membrane beta-barrel protein [Ferruginibacter sp.]